MRKILSPIFLILGILFWGVLSPANARTFFLYGETPGDPISCDTAKLTITISAEVPATEENFLPPEIQTERTIYEGVCPAGPLTFEAEDEDVLTITVSSRFLYPVVKKGRVVKTGEIRVPSIKLCTTENCVPLLTSFELNAPFYEDFLVLGGKIGKLFSLKRWSLLSSGNRPPFIDDSFILEVTGEDFYLLLRAVDGIPDNNPLILHLPPDAGVTLLVFSLLEDGHLDPLDICSDTRCVSLLSDSAGLLNYFDTGDSRKFTAYLSDDDPPVGWFYGSPENDLFFSLSQNLTNVIVRGDNFYFSSGKWHFRKAPLDIPAGDYPLGKVPGEVRFLAAGPHTLSVFDETRAYAAITFDVPDSDGNHFSPKVSSSLDPTTLLGKDADRVFVSVEPENFIVQNLVPGRKLGEFDLHIGDPGSGSDRLVRRWCEVFEPSLFEWVSPKLSGFFYFSYHSREIVDVVGSVLFRCFEQIEREKQDEEGNTTKEVFVQIIAPPQDMDMTFSLESPDGNAVHFRAKNRKDLAEGTVAMWFNDRLTVSEPVTFDTKVRIIAREAALHHMEYEGRRVSLSPSPIEIVGLYGNRGFDLETVATSSEFAALKLKVGAKVEASSSSIPPGLKLLLVVNRTGETLADADSFYEFPFVNGTCRAEIFFDRTASDPETVTVRFLAIDRNGIIYPGAVVNKAYTFRIPDPFTRAVVVLSTPENVTPGDPLRIDVYLDTVSDEDLLFYRLKLGFYRKSRGWIWIRDIIDGQPLGVFEESTLAQNFYRDENFSISVTLPDDFLSFTVMGAYVVYAEAIDGLTEEVLDNTVTILKILP